MSNVLAINELKEIVKTYLGKSLGSMINARFIDYFWVSLIHGYL
jgi:hypothetical protein